MKKMKNNNLYKNFLEVDQQERIDTLVKAENYKFWLGGFVEGEGTLVVSLVKNSKVTYKLVLQPEFNVAQHENGINILHSFKSLFNGLGSVHKKSGSDKVWVYSLKGTQNLKNLVIPFFAKYVTIYSSKYNPETFKSFGDILEQLYANKNKTMDKQKFIKLVELAYSLNPDGKGKQRKITLDEIINIINE